ncbi:hypothetical protein [Actinoplanes sp. RD1]|uniref:hypothetical protein n=1 Tax=Actinoplanes sp. RD1 TaxID=3064538 RepID=UPI002740C739|nr:hypothetical protein [Actinoplanes sp. RD1]
MQPALRYAAEEWGAPELDAIADHVARLSGDPVDEPGAGPGERDGYEQHEELGAWQHDDVAGVLAELFDDALPGDTCRPWTAERVPVLAALAVDQRLTDYHRAWAVAYLVAVATAGRRRADGPENADERAARAAVAAAVPDIAARADDSELFGFLAAALALACPEAGAAALAGRAARRWAGQLPIVPELLFDELFRATGSGVELGQA